MKSNAVYFGAEEVAKLAEYVYKLTTLGAAYIVEESQSSGGWYVTVTGY